MNNIQNYYIYDENGDKYLFKEIVTKEEFDYRIEQIEIKKKEKELIRLKKLEVDPFDEEDWDHSYQQDKKIKRQPHLIIRPVRPATEGERRQENDNNGEWFERNLND
jgi:hypothetical protein